MAKRDITTMAEIRRKAAATPTANANGPYTADTDEDINFSSAGSTDPRGKIVTYLWDFGDTTSSAEANPTKSYSSADTYNVSLTVTDDSGNSDEDTTTATISNP